jgi:hypothetical protein
MLNTIGKLAIASIVPKLVTTIYAEAVKLITPDKEEEVVKSKHRVKGKLRKIRDCHRLTTEERAWIGEIFRQWSMDHKEVDMGVICHSREELGRFFNQKLNINKSRSFWYNLFIELSK